MKRIVQSIFIILVISLTGCTSHPDKVSLEKAKTIATERVITDYNYKAYNGSNLRVLKESELNDNYYFNFRYDVKGYPANISEIQIDLFVRDGKAMNYSLTELPENK